MYVGRRVKCLSVCLSLFGFLKIVVCRQILLLISNMNYQEDSSVGYMRPRGTDNPSSRIFCKGMGPKRTTFYSKYML